MPGTDDPQHRQAEDAGHDDDDADDHEWDACYGGEGCVGEASCTGDESEDADNDEQDASDECRAGEAR
ncbi:hypothetical protein [Corynebacterium variabile]|uniref:hypothetical protein n=1 Tax=Corynebacterium variabile TaxID=1727 RepID=UPI003A8D0C45